jgi:hypothetical protein
MFRGEFIARARWRISLRYYSATGRTISFARVSDGQLAALYYQSYVRATRSFRFPSYFYKGAALASASDSLKVAFARTNAAAVRDDYLYG